MAGPVGMVTCMHYDAPQMTCSPREEDTPPVAHDTVLEVAESCYNVHTDEL